MDFQASLVGAVFDNLHLALGPVVPGFVLEVASAVNQLSEGSEIEAAERLIQVLDTPSDQSQQFLRFRVQDYLMLREDELLLGEGPPTETGVVESLLFEDTRLDSIRIVADSLTHAQHYGLLLEDELILHILGLYSSYA